MRKASLCIVLTVAALPGCRNAEQFVVKPAVTQSAPAPPQPTKPGGALTAVQPASFDEAIPVPAATAETLPATTLKPAALGALSLDDLEQMALTTNPSVTRSVALVEAARGNWVQVGLAPNPSFGYEGQQIGSRGLAEQDGVYIQQEIVRGGKLRLNRNVAAQEIAKAEHRLATQQQRVLTDVRVAFYQVLIAQRQEQLTANLRNVAAEGVKTSESLQRGKEVGRADVVQSQLELENVEILVQNARHRSRAAWQALAAVVGNPQLSPQPLIGEIDEERPIMEWHHSLQRLLSTSPEVAAAIAELERARWAAERARVEKTPNVTVQGLVNWRDNGIGGGSDGAISVGVPIPLWDRNQGGIVQASQEAVAAERALQQLELSLQNRLAPVYERYANALNQVTKYRTKILPAAKQSLDLLRQTYEAGETGYVNLLTAQRTYSQTNLNYLESLRELRISEAEIEGLLLSDSLESR